MPFDKNTLTPEQQKTYEQLVIHLKTDQAHVDQQAARIVAMIPGAGDLLYVPGAMAAAETEAGIWFTSAELDAHINSLEPVQGKIRYNPLTIQ